MSNSKSNDQHESEPEITAQPRLVSDEIGLAASAEPDLSVDPDDLGARFLRDAVEQGDFSPDRAASEDASLLEVPARDGARVSPAFSPASSVWEQTIDFALRTGVGLREHSTPPSASLRDRDNETEPLPVTHPPAQDPQLAPARALRKLAGVLRTLADRIDPSRASAAAREQPRPRGVETDDPSIPHLPIG